MTKSQEIFQSDFAGREMRYAVMRLFRFMGWVFFPAGMFIMLFGFAQALCWMCDMRPGMSMLEGLFGGAMIFFIGIFIIFLSFSICVPYQYESRSSEAKTARCKRCAGELINPENIFPTCIECKSAVPLRYSVMLARFVSSNITATHIILVTIGFLFALL